MTYRAELIIKKGQEDQFFQCVYRSVNDFTPRLCSVEEGAPQTSIVSDPQQALEALMSGSLVFLSNCADYHFQNFGSGEYCKVFIEIRSDLDSFENLFAEICGDADAVYFGFVCEEDRYLKLHRITREIQLLGDVEIWVGRDPFRKVPAIYTLSFWSLGYISDMKLESLTQKLFCSDLLLSKRLLNGVCFRVISDQANVENCVKALDFKGQVFEFSKARVEAEKIEDLAGLGAFSDRFR